MVPVAQLLLRWCDKECGIFNTLCTVIWIFAQNPNMNNVIFILLLNFTSFSDKLENVNNNMLLFSFLTFLL